jgi:hypothetical protein
MKAVTVCFEGILNAFRFLLGHTGAADCPISFNDFSIRKKPGDKTWYYVFNRQSRYLLINDWPKLSQQLRPSVHLNLTSFHASSESSQADQHDVPTF